MYGETSEYWMLSVADNFVVHYSEGFNTRGRYDDLFRVPINNYVRLFNVITMHISIYCAYNYFI